MATSAVMTCFASQVRLTSTLMICVVLNSTVQYTAAFDRTGRIINITVAPINNYDPPRLLNYLTAPHICVWSAAAASCAVPGLFDSITLIVKEPNGMTLHLSLMKCPYIILYCSSLHCSALHYTTPHPTTPHYTTLCLTIITPHPTHTLHL